jgi:hypothetical protein
MNNYLLKGVPYKYKTSGHKKSGSGTQCWTVCCRIFAPEAYFKELIIIISAFRGCSNYPELISLQIYKKSLDKQTN